MRRRSLLCLVVLAMTLTLGRVPAAGAQVSTPASAATAPLDLATMMLVPADVHRAQVGLRSGGPIILDLDYAPQAATLRAAGDRAGFEQWLGPPDTSQDYQVVSAIDAFKDATGAATGYTIIRGGDQGVVRGVPTVGNASALFRLTLTDPYDERRPDQRLALFFRVDRLVATIYVDNYTASKPHAAEAIALGQIMAARIKHVLAGDPTKPGLSNRAARFPVPLSASFQDGYYRLNGQDRVGWQGDLAKGQPTFDQTYPGATTVLLVGRHASTAAGAPWERLRLVQFPTSQAASSWVRGYIPLAERANGWRQVRPVAGAAAFGEQSQTVTFQWPAGTGAPGPTVYGAAITTRYGALAVSVRIEAYKPVPVKLVAELMRAQAQCLQATATCPRVTPSQSLLALTVSPGTGWAPPAFAASAATGDSRRSLPRPA